MFKARDQWSGFDIRHPFSRRLATRMSNPKLHWHVVFAHGPLILTFAKEPAAGGCECWNRTIWRCRVPNTDLHDSLAAAIDANWDRQVEWLKTLVGFPSLRGAEGPCQDWIAREFAQRGWSVDRYTLSD